MTLLLADEDIERARSLSLRRGDLGAGTEGIRRCRWCLGFLPCCRRKAVRKAGKGVWTVSTLWVADSALPVPDWAGFGMFRGRPVFARVKMQFESDLGHSVSAGQQGFMALGVHKSSLSVHTKPRILGMASIWERKKSDGSTSFTVRWRNPETRKQEGITLATSAEAQTLKRVTEFRVWRPPPLNHKQTATSAPFARIRPRLLDAQQRQSRDNI